MRCDKYKFNYIICLFSVFSIIEFGCARHYDYDEVKDKLYKNKGEFDKLTKDYLNQNLCFTIFRRDFSKEKSFIPYSGETFLIYWVTPLLDLKTYEIVIPKEFERKEEKFWEKDYKDIKGFEHDDLETFLNRYRISKSFFDMYRDFLRINELYGIERDRFDSCVTICFGPIDGLIYQPEKGTTPKHPLAREIKKIDDNWFYFREW